MSVFWKQKWILLSVIPVTGHHLFSFQKKKRKKWRVHISQSAYLSLNRKKRQEKIDQKQPKWNPAKKNQVEHRIIMKTTGKKELDPSQHSNSMGFLKDFCRWISITWVTCMGACTIIFLTVYLGGRSTMLWSPMITLLTLLAFLLVCSRVPLCPRSHGGGETACSYLSVKPKPHIPSNYSWNCKFLSV